MIKRAAFYRAERGAAREFRAQVSLLLPGAARGQSRIRRDGRGG
jgi:hypothetical protein